MIDKPSGVLRHIKRQSSINFRRNENVCEVNHIYGHERSLEAKLNDTPNIWTGPNDIDSFIISEML